MRAFFTTTFAEAEAIFAVGEEEAAAAEEVMHGGDPQNGRTDFRCGASRDPLTVAESSCRAGRAS
jgi:hypothetical protein